MSETATASHYDEQYFAWQQSLGRFGGMADSWKFQKYIGVRDYVLDFGCGGGYMLDSLSCARRLGVEINPAARAACVSSDIDVVPDLDGVPDEWANVAISNHALEHVPDPLGTLITLRGKIRPGGTLVLVVPCESVKTAYRPDNQDRHLFTWSPMNAGNLVEEAGFKVQSSAALLHQWLPRPITTQRYIGWPLFHLGSMVRGNLFKRLSQVRVVAKVE